MDAAPKCPPLLSALEALIHNDPGLPGFRGTVAIGVRTPLGPRWWTVELGDRARSQFRDAVPPGADVALLLGEASAASILESGTAAAGDVALLGDAQLLERFVARYFKKQGTMDLRMAVLKGNAKPKPKRTR